MAKWTGWGFGVKSNTTELFMFCRVTRSHCCSCGHETRWLSQWLNNGYDYSVILNMMSDVISGSIDLDLSELLSKSELRIQYIKLPLNLLILSSETQHQPWSPSDLFTRWLSSMRASYHWNIPGNCRSGEPARLPYRF